MLDMGQHWRIDTRVVFPRKAVRRSVGPNLVVDLLDEPFTNEWWRGATTLALLCGAAVMLMPKPFEALPAPAPAMGQSGDDHFRDLGVNALERGGSQGGAMAPAEAAMPIARAPERSHLDIEATLAKGDTLAALLYRMGATRVSAQAVAAAVGSIDHDEAALSFRLGAREGNGRRAVERLTVRARLDTIVHVQKGEGGLSVTREAIATETAPIRFDGVVGEGLYFAMRSAGVGTDNAAAFLKLLDARLDLASDVMPGDRFTLVMQNKRNALGQSEAGELAYAALERQGGANIRLAKWPVGGTRLWVDVDRAGQDRASSGSWPVNARISSGFGMRRHPILRYMRMHSGIDFAAGWGTPIVAAADGVVLGAGRAGGYGRQVRISHAGGLSTSYSHMSRFIVSPGMRVAEGQVIGYVGSTGLSTGPHLHYEVKRNGRAIDPRSVTFATRPLMTKAQIAEMKAAVASLLKTAQG